MHDLSIGELARRVGLRSSALRYYEQIGLLPVPARQHGQRRYSPTILPRLAAIQAAQRAGFTIAEIQTLLDGFTAELPFSERWRILAAQKYHELAILVTQAQAMQQRLIDGAACACTAIEACPILNDASMAQL